MRLGRATRILTLAMFSAAVSHGIVTECHAATVTPVGPFTGDFHDNFNRFTTTAALQVCDIYDSHGTLRMIDADGAIKMEPNSTFNGDLVVPRSGFMCGMLGVVDWEFDEPTSRFGGYWENNSGASHANLEFFDASGNLLGTAIANVPVAAQAWTWNGWELDVPFSRIRVTGNGVVNGFIWFEDMEMTLAVPEPGAAAATFIGFSLLALRRIRCGKPAARSSLTSIPQILPLATFRKVGCNISDWSRKARTSSLTFVWRIA